MKLCGSPNCWNFGTPTWELWTKSHLDVAPMESCIIYYMGEGGGFPQVRVVVSLVSPKSSVACPSTKGVLEIVLTNLWLVECKFE
jgi:hypothetical protein